MTCVLWEERFQCQLEQQRYMKTLKIRDKCGSRCGTIQNRIIILGSLKIEK